MHTANEGMSMAGKGSRQRTYGSAFESNYDKIFRKAHADQIGMQWVAEEAPDDAVTAAGQALPQYPQEVREDAQRRSQKPSWDVES